MQNLEYIKYTYFHRKAIKLLAEIYLTEDEIELMKNRIDNHDIDKMLMYTFLPKDVSSNIHGNTASHHLQNTIVKTKLDFIEIALDIESARYTKENKPLNGYDTVYCYYLDWAHEIIPILKKWKIDKPNLPMIESVFEKLEKIKQITTIDDIVNEITNYVDKNLTK